MRPDNLTDQEMYIRAMVDHPAGTAGPGRHREPELTPLEHAKQGRVWPAASAIMWTLIAVGAVMLVSLIAVSAVRVVIAL